MPGSQDVIFGWAEGRKVADASFSGVPALGDGDGEGALIIDSGAKMLKI